MPIVSCRSGEGRGTLRPRLVRYKTIVGTRVGPGAEPGAAQRLLEQAPSFHTFSEGLTRVCLGYAQGMLRGRAGWIGGAYYERTPPTPPYGRKVLCALLSILSTSWPSHNQFPYERRANFPKSLHVLFGPPLCESGVCIAVSPQLFPYSCIDYILFT